MRIISMVNLKGGVGKTTTAINMGAVLAHDYGKRVLLVDNDIQANITRKFNLFSYENPSMEQIYRHDDIDAGGVICRCGTGGCVLDVIPSNPNMDVAITELMKDEKRQQYNVLQNALRQIWDDYDFCIIDNPPGIGMNVINALACTHDIIIPIKMDKYAMDGMQDLVEFCTDIAEFNDDLHSVRGLVTMFYNITEIVAGEMVLKRSDYDIYDTHIRYSKKADVFSFSECESLLKFSPRSSACIDYRRFVKEYLGKLPEDRCGEGFDA